MTNNPPFQRIARQPGTTRRRSRQAATAIAISCLLASLAGCGGSGEHTTVESSTAGQAANAGGTAQDALASTAAAIKNAQSVTIAGETRQLHGFRFKVNLKLTRTGGQGTITALGSTYEVIRAGDHLYLKAAPVVYRRMGIEKTVPADAWVALSSTNAVGAVIDLSRQPSRLISSPGNVTKGETTTIGGEPALELKTAGKLYAGRLYVKATGEALPLKLEKKGRETGAFTFTHWNSTPAPVAPSKVVSGGS